MAAEFSLTMKLLIDTETNRVIFAEASKECVDFLFHLLSLPIARVIKLLQENDGMVGSLENLYHSIENLHDSYVVKQHTRDSLLKPNLTSCACSSVPMLQLKHVPSEPEKNFYVCGYDYCSSNRSSYGTRRVTDGRNTVCPDCNRRMEKTISYMAPPSVKVNAATNEGGFVKGLVTYMVMDDLVVTPMSTISCITLLGNFNIKNVGVLQEKTVNIGFTEAVRLLKASLHSKKVLTEVFLTKIEPKVFVEEPIESGEGDDASIVNQNESKAAVEEQGVVA